MTTPIDFSGGGATADRRVATDESDVDKAAQQLEAYFLRRVLSEVKIGGGLVGDGFAGDTFQSMLTEALADTMAEAGGLGISSVFVDQLEGESMVRMPGRISRRSGVEAYSATAALSSPVDGTPSSKFGMRDHPITGERKLHAGLDIAATTGTEVRAARDGKVMRAGKAGGYGNLIVIEHADGLRTRYGHLSAIDVKVGDPVAAGAAIGKVGATGTATGPHLHFEVRRDGKPIDPATVLNKPK